MSEPTGFLYPFIEGDERDTGRLLSDLASSARSKMAESHQLQVSTLDLCGDQLHQAGADMARRFDRGGRLFTFGNGGSATDAQGAANLFRHPHRGRPLPATSLVDDPAVLTALSNDVGFEVVFSRQLIAHAREDDMALGLSTSGGSANVLRAFDEAKRRGMFTVGLSGYEGGAMAVSDAVNVCLIVRSESIHRIQETQDALVYALWAVVQQQLAAPGPP